MPAPAVVVVASIGPRPRSRRRQRGALGQLGLTTAMPRRDPVITLAAAALDVDDVDVLDHLVAHELGHVAYLRSWAGRRYQRAVLIGLVILGLGLLAWFTGTVAQVSTGTNPWPWAALVWPTAGVLSLVLLAVRRRQELAADGFAIRLAPNLAAAGALFELEEGAGVLAESRAFSRLLAPHPPPRARLARMRRQLARAA